MMNVRYVRLICEKREELGRGLPALTDDLQFLRERKGEKILALDPSTDAVLGWIGIYPDRDEGGPFFHLSSIEVQPARKSGEIGIGLMEAAREHMRARRAARLRFGTSPLLTGNAELYVTRFGTRYWWKEGVRTPQGRPWPFVSCECDFDDPLARPLDLADEEVLPRSVLDWDGSVPVPRTGVRYTGPLSVVLPEISSDRLAGSEEREPEFLAAMHRVFHDLYKHGYGFAWFDRLPQGMAPDSGARFFYVMNRIVAAF